MNECERQEMALSSWLDGETAGDAAPAVEVLDHLVRCPSCRAFYREARALDGVLAGVRPAAPAAEPPPERLWEGIRDAASLEGSRWSRLPAWSLRAAALLLVGLGLLFALAAPAPEGSENGADVMVELAADDDMTEARFVELTTEVMRADRRFHFAMLDVMQQVVEDTEGEGSSHERRSKESGDDRENDKEARDRDVV